MLLQLSWRYAVGIPKSAAEVAGILEPPPSAYRSDGLVAVGRRSNFSPSSLETLRNDPLDQLHASRIAQFVQIPDRNTVGPGNGDRCEISVGQVPADIGEHPGGQRIGQHGAGRALVGGSRHDERSQ